MTFAALWTMRHAVRARLSGARRHMVRSYGQSVAQATACTGMVWPVRTMWLCAST